MARVNLKQLGQSGASTGNPPYWNGSDWAPFSPMVLSESSSAPVATITKTLANAADTGVTVDTTGSGAVDGTGFYYDFDASGSVTGGVHYGFRTDYQGNVTATGGTYRAFYASAPLLSSGLATSVGFEVAGSGVSTSGFAKGIVVGTSGHGTIGIDVAAGWSTASIQSVGAAGAYAIWGINNSIGGIAIRAQAQSSTATALQVSVGSSSNTAIEIIGSALANPSIIWDTDGAGDIGASGDNRPGDGYFRNSLTIGSGIFNPESGNSAQWSMNGLEWRGIGSSVEVKAHGDASFTLGNGIGDTLTVPAAVNLYGNYRTSGNGGPLNIRAGNADGTAHTGGDIGITGGSSTGSNEGGDITITGGAGVSGTGGEVNIFGGASSSSAGGEIVIYAGAGGTVNGRIIIGLANTSRVEIGATTMGLSDTDGHLRLPAFNVTGTPVATVTGEGHLAWNSVDNKLWVHQGGGTWVEITTTASSAPALSTVLGVGNTTGDDVGIDFTSATKDTMTIVSGSISMSGGSTGSAALRKIALLAGSGGTEADGGEITIHGGDGGASAGTATGGAGGGLTVEGADGGAGGLNQDGGAGGSVTIDAGAGGAIGSGTSVAGTNGTVSIGTTNASAVTIASSGNMTTVQGGLTLTNTGLTMTGLDIGGTSTEIGNIYLADEKTLYLGSGQEGLVYFDADGSDNPFSAPAFTITTTGEITVPGNLATPLWIEAASASTAAYQGGPIIITGGVGATTASGGGITITGGQGGATGQGGGLTFTAGAGGATSGSGGNAEFVGGGATSGDGGDARLRAGAGAGASGAGGDAWVYAGVGAGTGNGGNVDIRAGNGNTVGTISIGTTANTASAINLGNSADNTTISQSGSGQVTFTGNVNATAGLDVTGGDLTVYTDFLDVHKNVGTGGGGLGTADTATVLTVRRLDGTVRYLYVNNSDQLAISTTVV